MIRAVVALLLAVAVAAPVGWRYDTSGAWPDADPPVTWSVEAPLWRTPLPGWSNASPVVAGDRVCGLTEPVTVWCADARTGRLLWSADNPVTSAVDAQERARIEAVMAERARVAAELEAARDAYGLLSRRARAAGSDAALAEQVRAAGAEVERLRAALAELPEYGTPDTEGIVGWSSPTPVTDGSNLYVLFGNGVVASYDPAGRRRWSRWLGRRHEPMLGWDTGQASSPVLAGDTLVVGYGRLRGLDAATGAVRWEGAAWPHFGAPAPLTVDGVPLVVTPDGAVLRAADGRVLANGLADVWYVNPVVDGDRVYFLETRSDTIVVEQGGVVLRAWRFPGFDGTRLRVESLWSVRIPTRDAFYTPPVPYDGRLWLVTRLADLYAVDAATGVVSGPVRISGLGASTIFSSPAVAGGRLYVTSLAGKVAVIAPGAEPKVLAVNEGWPTRASPAFSGARMFVRGRAEIVALGH